MTSKFRLKIMSDDGRETYHVLWGRPNAYFPGQEVGLGIIIVNVMEEKNAPRPSS